RKIELSDYVITNTDLENTEKQVQELHLRLIKAREQ
ncbi:dephospho-CoA kinase, partial [Sinomicrobium sp. FJxs]|nr:dephospho-CoA kinase [Sinomicrobium weinanense]